MNEKIKARYLSLLQAACPNAFRADASREDAGETLVIQRALDHVEQRITEVMYAELRALRFVPVIPGIDPGEKTYTFMVLDRVGRAAPAGGRDRDAPRAEVFLSEITSGIKTYDAEYGYTVQELRNMAAAQKRGLNLALDTLRAETAALMIAHDIDSVVAFGDPLDARVRGFLNNASVTTDTAAVDWNVATPEELYAELLALANTQLIVSKETHQPDAILLPTKHWTLVGTTQFGTAGLKTVLDFFNDAMKSMGRSVSVASWPLLATADAARTGPRAVAYKRDVNVAGAIVPLAFQAQPPQARGKEWIIPCDGVCGGTAVKQPLGLYYRDGLDG
jgi:hypothetical protein